MRRITNLVTATAIALAILGFARPANAVLTLYLESGVSSVTISDGGAGDLNPLAGAVTFIGGVGVFTLNVTTGLSAPILSFPQLLDLNSVNATTTTGGTLTIRLGEIDFNVLGILLAEIGGTIGPGGTLSYQLYQDSDNNFDLGNVGSLGTVICSGGSFGTGAFSDSQSCLASAPTPYGLILEVTLTHSGVAASSFDYSVRVPEPSAMLLFGLGLVGLGVWGRKRLRK